MKTYKKFFEHGSLNKGYARSDDIAINSTDNLKQKYQNILPPIDMVEQYEELYPGTFKQLIKMSEQEQKHRHSMVRLQIEKENKSLYIAKIFSLLFVIAICITTITLSFMGNFIEASIFAAASFLTVIVISAFNCSRKKKNNCRDKNHNITKSVNNAGMRHKKGKKK